MNALAYILVKSLLNVFKGLLKKPAALIAYIVMAVFFIGMFLLSGLQGKASSKHLEPDIVIAIYVAYVVFMLLLTLVASLANGASFFRLADVNFLFTAPVKPGNILIYGFIRQLAINIGVMVFVSFQFPTWKNLFGLRNGAGSILAIAYILLLIVTSLASIALYSFVSRKPGRRKAVKAFLYCGTALFLAPVAIGAVRTGDLLQSAIAWLSSSNMKYIPLIGWLRQVLLGTLSGITPSVAINALLLLAFSAALLVYLYSLDTGFYEDALASSETKEQMVKAFREGKSGAVSLSGRKYRKVKFNFTMEGSRAILQKQMLMQRKSGVGFVGIKTVVLLVCALIATFVIKVEPGMLLMIFLGASVYVMMIFTMMESAMGEFSKHYIYMIPASPFSKMVYSTLPDVIKLIIEGILLLGVSGILKKCPLEMTAAAVAAYSSIGAVFIFSDLFIRRIFGKIHGKVLRLFFRIILVILVLILGITPAAVIIAIAGNYTLAFLASAGINGVIAFLFMLSGVGLFIHPEFEG